MLLIDQNKSGSLTVINLQRVITRPRSSPRLHRALQHVRGQCLPFYGPQVYRLPLSAFINCVSCHNRQNNHQTSSDKTTVIFYWLQKAGCVFFLFFCFVFFTNQRIHWRLSFVCSSSGITLMSWPLTRGRHSINSEPQSFEKNSFFCVKNIKCHHWNHMIPDAVWLWHMFESTVTKLADVKLEFIALM